MNVRTAAERLEISLSLTYALIQGGKLKCTRHGLKRGCIRISEKQLADYLVSAEPATPKPHWPSVQHITLPTGA